MDNNKNNGNQVIGFCLAQDKDYHSIECITDFDTHVRKTNVYWQNAVPYYRIKKRKDSQPTMIVAYDEVKR